MRPARLITGTPNVTLLRGNAMPKKTATPAPLQSFLISEFGPSGVPDRYVAVSVLPIRAINWNDLGWLAAQPRNLRLNLKFEPIRAD